MLASMGGGLVGLGFSLNGPDRIDILSQINGILGSLVAITGEFQYKIINIHKIFVALLIILQCQLGGCFLFRAWESIIVGMIGAFITCFTMPLLDKMHIDDPVGASATHGFNFFS